MARSSARSIRCVPGGVPSITSNAFMAASKPAFSASTVAELAQAHLWPDDMLDDGPSLFIIDRMVKYGIR